MSSPPTVNRVRTRLLHEPMQGQTRSFVMTTGRIKTSLLSLPDELLSTIFFEVVYNHGSRTAAFALTCRRLAPIVRQEVYWELEFWDGRCKTGNRLLLELCGKRPDLRAFVRVLSTDRVQETSDDGELHVDYTAEHPCIQLLRVHFPAFHTLHLFEATPVDIFDVLSRLSATTGPDIRKLSLGYVPDPELDGDSEHKETWWHLLARLPMLENLRFYTMSSVRGHVRIVFDDTQAFFPLPNLHSLTLDGPPWDPVGGPALAALFPNLKRLRLACHSSSAELETLLRQAPISLLHLTLSTTHFRIQDLQPDVLTRFPLLERLSLCRIGATASLTSIRTMHIKHIRLSYGAELADQDLRSLVDSSARMQHLKALELDYMKFGPKYWFERDLKDALGRDSRHDLAQVKAAMLLEWPQGCSAQGLREVMDAARKNGIKVFGTVVDCLDWSDRFDEQAECYLVDDALASNDYTTIERYLGEVGAGKAILRQRPRLAELVRKGMT